MRAPCALVRTWCRLTGTAPVRVLVSSRRVVARRGSIVPIVAAALVAVLGVLALVIDRLWVDAAKVELLRAAEAAALAGARCLADDDRLKRDADPAVIAGAAALSAVEMGRKNYVAGRPLELDFEADVAVGAYAESESTGRSMFLTETGDPQTVIVRPALLRGRNNPVALLIRAVHGPDFAELSVRVEASVNNLVYGVRPLLDTAVPALPLGILRKETTDQKRPSWSSEIDGKAGADLWGYDLTTRSVVHEPDGIPEITLTLDDESGVADGETTPASRKVNAALLKFGSESSSERLPRQLAQGLTAVDLERTGGELTPDHRPFNTSAKFRLASRDVKSLSALGGEARLLLLYSERPAPGPNEQAQVRCEALVAGRIVNIEHQTGQPVRIILQPAVVATRTAIASDEEHVVRKPNPYLYHLSLTAPR